MQLFYIQDFHILYLFAVEVTETHKQHFSLTELKKKKLNCLLKLIIHVDTQVFLLSFSLLYGSCELSGQ
jgi:predicted metal-binding protein